ncbi:uncharacterized protein LOC109201620 isoform X2 [Oreochromis niloticus]|uniref:uncharacterized protein LOC109201620 isoform X2 n=1 Tax=Oreochromis niloticus TaxID=8128 RepID=UPI0009058E75|nr:uncharacterized protein LOC109201620 isoform X2 [Oreochromis niloticus]
MRRKKSSRSIFRDLYDVIERRRREGRPRLIQLENLTRRSRTLTLLFQGTLQTRLLATARECGRRWDDVNAKQESITGRLQSGRDLKHKGRSLSFGWLIWMSA